MILNDRIMKIQSVIEKYGIDTFYLSFSGGKDSTVLSYLLDEALPGNKITRVFVNTGIEMKAIVDFVKEIAEREREIRYYLAELQYPQNVRVGRVPV